MTQAVYRIIFSLVLLALGVLNLYFYVLVITREDGAELRVLPSYVSPGFQLATLIGGLGLIVVSVFMLLTQRVHAGCSHDHGEHEHADEEHDHGDMNPIVALLILGIPIIFSVYHTEHRYTEVELSRRSEQDVNPEMFESSQFQIPEFTLETLDEYKTKNANGAYQMGVMELFLTAGDPTVSKVLDGVKVEIEGAVRSQPGEEENPAVKRIYRMMMQCCAADMQAIPIKLNLSEELSESFDYPEHTWITLEATVGYQVDKHGSNQTVLEVNSIEKASPPDTEILLSGQNSVMQDKL